MSERRVFGNSKTRLPDKDMSDLDAALALAIGFRLSASDPRSPLSRHDIILSGALVTSLL
jgi:hypothetical protein